MEAKKAWDKHSYQRCKFMDRVGIREKTQPIAIDALYALFRVVHGNGRYQSDQSHAELFCPQTNQLLAIVLASQPDGFRSFTIERKERIIRLRLENEVRKGQTEWTAIRYT